MRDRLETLIGEEVILRIKPENRFVHVMGTLELRCEPDKPDTFEVEGNAAWVDFRTEHVESIKMVASGDPPLSTVFIILYP